MSQKIYLDDCAYDKDLVRLLEAAGHQVTTPAQAGITAEDDPVHFDFAAKHDLILISKNPRDFLDLHKADSQHAGILLVYQDNDSARDMTFADIVTAIANLERAGVEFRACCHVLNAWRY